MSIILFINTKMANALRPFLGPAFLVAIGYLDPGNWATDIEAGASYGYQLLWVVMVSSAMAMFLQYLCVRLGVYKRVDLAEACRLNCPKWLNAVLYVVAEVAIVACDIAEVIGTAIAMKLLFGVPVKWGVFMTGVDVILLMSGVCDGNEHILSVIMAGLLTAITTSFLLQMFIVKPDFGLVMKGLTTVKLNTRDSTYWLCILGILGATVMPHNLYLHSFLAKNKVKKMEEREYVPELESVSSSCGDNVKVWYLILDLMIALSIAFLANAGILIVSAAAFYKDQSQLGHPKSIEDAAYLLKSTMGTASFLLFGTSLLASGLTSTITGTLAGQIVFEGFWDFAMAPWKRRLITRSLAIVPAIIIVYTLGSDALERMLVYSQVVLSFQLPFAVIPLAIFAFDDHFKWCSGTDFALKIITIIVTVTICLLNIAGIVNALFFN
jgi:manganese transport protein